MLANDRLHVEAQTRKDRRRASNRSKDSATAQSRGMRFPNRFCISTRRKLAQQGA